MDIKRIRRDKLRLSQNELGQLLGVDQATVSRLETGKQDLDPRTMLAVEALCRRHQAGEPLATDQVSAG